MSPYIAVNSKKRIRYSLTKEQVKKAMKGVFPEAIREHCVEIDGILFPVKQVLAIALGLQKLDFTSMDARNILSRLGFEFKSPLSQAEQNKISRTQSSKRYELIGYNVLKLANEDKDFKKDLMARLKNIRLTPHDAMLFELPQGATLDDLF